MPYMSWSHVEAKDEKRSKNWTMQVQYTKDLVRSKMEYQPNNAARMEAAASSNQSEWPVEIELRYVSR